MIAFIIYSGVLATVIYVIHRYFSHNFDYWEKRNIKGPKPWPIFGDLLNNILSQKLHKNYESYTRIYGNVFGTFAFTQPVFNVAEPQLIKNILVKDFDKFINRINFKFENQLLDTMLNFATNDLWRKLRVKMTPTFSTGKMKKMFPIIEYCAKDMINQIDEVIQINDEIDVKTFYGNFILDVITKIAFAVDVNCDANFKKQLHRNAKIVFDPPIWKILIFIACRRIVSKFPQFFNPQLYVITNFIEKMIQERSKNPQKNVDFMQLLLDDEMDTESNENEDIIHLNIESDVFDKKSFKQQKLSKIEITANCVMFLIVGFHTITHLLVFITYILALNSDKQEILYEEIKRNLNKDGTINYDTLMRLNYLDAVICETLRVLPPATHISRVTGQDYEIESIPGLVLEKSTLVQIPIYGLHQNPDYFPEPDKFKPERFLPENRENIIPYTYLPFGAGPRNCIGMRFALMEAKIGICSVISKYKIVKCEKTPTDLVVNNFDGLLRVDNLTVKFVPRNCNRECKE